jgi:catechol 2,3-dioxygenase
MTPYQERVRDVAHLSAVELFTPDLEATVGFFVQLMSLEEVRREDGVVFLHCWDDYESFTLRVVARDRPGVGRTWLRTSSPQALQRRVSALEQAGTPGRWVDGELGTGPTYEVPDPDGHTLALYWESQRYTAPAGRGPALKNQAAPFPGRGANVRRLDHVNYLASDVGANGRFLADALGARLSEQIVTDDGAQAAGWYTFSDKSYDLVYTGDWTGAQGRLHHIAFATDTREDILRACDVFLEAGIFIETGPHQPAIQRTCFLYVYEPGGNRIELCNAGARLLLSPDAEPVTWTSAERAKGQAWGLKTIPSFHTHGTPPVDETQS